MFIRGRTTQVYLLIILLMATIMWGCGRKGQPAAQQNITLSEQKEVVERVLSDYFKVAKDFSQGEYDSDEVYKNELKARYLTLMTGQLLGDFNRFVDEGSVQSDYFMSAFMREVNSSIDDIIIESYSGEAIEAKAVVSKDYVFSSISDDFASPSFVEDNRVSGLGQKEFSELVSKHNPVSMKSLQKKKYIVQLVLEEGVWKFERLDSEVEETKLIELQTWDGQQVSL